MNKVTCGMVQASVPSSVKSRVSSSSSKSSDGNSKSSSMGPMMKRHLNKGDEALANGDYENTKYYFESFLNRVEFHYEKSDDIVILAHEKLADAEAAFGKLEEAIRYYRIGLDELRTKSKDSVSDVEYEKDVNTRFARMLNNCGNVYLQLSTNKNIKKRRMSEYCENAILCYQESLPLTNELNGMRSAVSIKLVQRYISARDNIAKFYLESDKINLASTQYQESIKTVLPYLNEFAPTPEEINYKEEKKSSGSSYGKESKRPDDKSYRLMQYLYLKQTINVGSLCFRQNRFEYVVLEYGEALQKVDLNEEDEDYDKKLDELPASVAKLVCTISQNLGSTCMKNHEEKPALEEVEKARQHFERAMYLNDKHNLGHSISLLGLGEACFELKEYDKALENLLKAEQLLMFAQSTDYKKSYSDAYSKIASIFEINKAPDNCFSYLEKQIQFIRWTMTGDDRKEEQRKDASAVWHRKACIQFKMKTYKDSLQSHEEALRYRSKIPDLSYAAQTLSSMGQVYAAKGDIKQALECYEGALDYSSDNEKMEIYFDMGHVLVKMSYDYEAIRSYQSCLALASNPDNIQWNVNIIVTCVHSLGQLLLKFEEFMLLKDICEDVLSKIDNIECSSEEKCTLLMYLGKAHFFLGDLDCAMNNYSDAHKKLSKNSDFECMKNAVFGIADVHVKKNQINKALACLEKLIASVSSSIIERFQRHMETAAIQTKIVSVNVQAERYDDALASCRKVLSAKEAAYSMVTGCDSDPDADIARTLAMTAEIYIKKKMYSSAMEQLRKASSVVDEKDSKALLLCTIAECETLMLNQNDAIDSLQGAYSMIIDDPDVSIEIKCTVIHTLAGFNAMAFRLEDAVENYQTALLLHNKDYEKDREELMRSLSKSCVVLNKDIDALQFFYSNKTRLNIESFCVSYDEIKSASNEIIRHFALEKDLRSCAKCVNCIINFAMLLIPDKIDLTIEMAKLLQQIGGVMLQAQDYEIAVKYHELSLCTKRILYSDENQDTSYTYSCLGEIYDRKGEHQNSLNNFKEAMNGSDSDNQLLIIDKMAMVLSQMERFNDAKDCYKSAIIMCENTEQRILLLNNLGNVYVCSGHLDEALSCYSEALTIKSKDLKLDEDTEYVLFNIGVCHFKKSAYDQALDSFTKFLSERASATFAKNNNLITNILASVLNYFGALNLKQKKYLEAIIWLEHSVTILREVPLVSVDLLAGALSNLGNALFYVSEYDTALLHFSEVIKLSKTMAKKNDVLLASVLGKSAWINFRLRNYELALENYQHAMDLKQKTGGTDIIVDVALIHNIALVKCKMHEFKDAITMLNQVRDHAIATYGAYHPDVGKVHIDLGIICYKQKQFTDAESHYAKASVILEKANCSQEDPYQIQYLNAVSKLWSKMNK